MANTVMNKERVSQLRRYLDNERKYAIKMVEMYTNEQNEKKANIWQGRMETYNEIECLLMGNKLFDGLMEIHL